MESISSIFGGHLLRTNYSTLFAVHRIWRNGAKFIRWVVQLTFSMKVGKEPKIPRNLRAKIYFEEIDATGSRFLFGR